MVLSDGLFSSQRQEDLEMLTSGLAAEGFFFGIRKPGDVTRLH